LSATFAARWRSEVDMRHITTATLRAHIVAPTNDEADGTPHATGPNDQQTQTDCLASDRLDQERKAFATLQAQFALRGYSLSSVEAAGGGPLFQVSRWGLVTELPDMMAIAIFAERVGVPSHG
jgi:hypothetical protein